MRKASFWAGVALVSVLSNYALTALSNHANIPGLSRFTAYAHSSGGS